MPNIPNLTKKEKKAYKEFSEVYKAHEKKKSVWDRIKEPFLSFEDMRGFE